MAPSVSHPARTSSHDSTSHDPETSRENPPWPILIRSVFLNPRSPPPRPQGKLPSPLLSGPCNRGVAIILLLSPLRQSRGRSVNQAHPAVIRSPRRSLQRCKCNTAHTRLWTYVCTRISLPLTGPSAATGIDKSERSTRIRAPQIEKGGPDQELTNAMERILLHVAKSSDKPATDPSYLSPLLFPLFCRPWRWERDAGLAGVRSRNTSRARQLLLLGTHPHSGSFNTHTRTLIFRSESGHGSEPPDQVQPASRGADDMIILGGNAPKRTGTIWGTIYGLLTKEGRKEKHE